MWVQIVVLFLLQILHPVCSWDKGRCPPSFQEYTDDSALDGDSLFPISFTLPRTCCRIFSNKYDTTWEEANRSCQKASSFLLDTDAVRYGSSRYKNPGLLNGLDFVWVGLRRINGFFTWHTTPRMFQENNLWQEAWEQNEPIHDCAALNVSSRKYITLDCSSSKLPYICMNDGFPLEPITNFRCPNGWKFSFHLNFDSDKCIYASPPKSYPDAFKFCKENSGQLVSSLDYHGLYHVLKGNYLGNFTTQAFWVNQPKWNPNRYSVENCTIKAKTAPPLKMTYKEYDCLDQLPFICKRPEKRAHSLNVWISPQVSNSLPSTETTSISEGLTCNTVIDGVTVGSGSVDASSGGDYTIAYEWQQNGVLLGDGYNFSTISGIPSLSISNSIFQGSYRCLVKLIGSPIVGSSEELDIFFSDISTYIINIRGNLVDPSTWKASYYAPIRHNASSIDYSHFHFRDLATQLLASPLSALVSDVNSLFPHASVQWDFQNMSLHNSWMDLKVRLYLNWTESDQSSNLRPIDEENVVYKPLTQLMKKDYNFTYIKNASLSIYSADVCFTDSAHIPKKGISLKWQETLQTKNAISDPICLNGLTSVKKRICKGSTVTGAKWQFFDYSLCTNYAKVYKDEEHYCPTGWTKMSDENMCYKIFQEKRTWEEANQICNAYLSYLSDDRLLIGNNSETTQHLQITNEDERKMWLSLKNFYGRYQWIGTKPNLMPNGSYVGKLNETWVDVFKNQNNFHLKWDDKNFTLFDCTIATGLSDGRYVIQPENCTDLHQFACIKQPLQLSSAPVCPESWIGNSFLKNCYYFSEQLMTWSQANSYCQSTHNGSSLLHSIRYMNTYSVIKSYIQEMSVNNSELSFWMGLKGNGRTLAWIDSNKSESEVYDWHRDTDFEIVDSAGLLVTDTSISQSQDYKRVQWSLERSDARKRFICEFPNFIYIHPAHVRIEVTGNKDVEYNAKIFQLPEFQCIPSGSYVNNIAWFKDGISPIVNFNRILLPLTVISPVDIEKVAQLQGYYWCAVDQARPLQKIFSKKILYQNEGIYTYSLIIQLFVRYLALCQSFTRNNFVLAEDLKDELNRLLLTPKHISTKNITCDRSTTTLLLHLHYLPSIKAKRSITDNEQQQYKSLQEAINQGKQEAFFHNMGINNGSVIVRSTVACYEEKTTSNGKILTWPYTLHQRTVAPEELCVTESGNSVFRKCLGDFNVGAYWGPIQGECAKNPTKLTQTLYSLSKRNITKSNVVTSSRKLSELTTNPEKLHPADVHYVAETLTNIARKPSESDVIKFAATAVDNVLSVESSVLDSSQNQLNSSSRIAESLEQIASTTRLSRENYQLTLNNVGLDIWSLKDVNGSIPVGLAIHKESWNLETLFNGSDLAFDKLEAGILLPLNLVERNIFNHSRENEQLSFVVYRNPSLFQNEKGWDVVRPIVHASLGAKAVYNLDPLVNMVFRTNLLNEENILKAKCAFWDQELNDNSGGWSDEGCYISVRKKDYVMCHCDHLTNFAIILKPHSIDLPIGHQTALSIISYIGCCLSIFGLGMTLLTYILFRKWRKGNKHQALCNLSVALIGLLIIFLIGIEKKQSRYGCLAVAILLHYFILASFAWMLVEAIMQYLNLVKVVGSYIPRFMRKAIVLAWGLPLLLVGIVLIIDYKIYESNAKYCWLSEGALIYSLALPVLLVILVNFVIFFLILYSIICGRDMSLRSNQDDRKQAMTRIRAAFCIYILLGLSWVFGFLAISETKLIFEYLFALTATLQGFFIFIFFVAQEGMVRGLWQNLVLTISSHSDSTTSTPLSHTK